MEEQEVLLRKSPNSGLTYIELEKQEQKQYLTQTRIEFENIILQEIYENIQIGNNSRIEEILGECENIEIINFQNSQGMTLLHFACDKSNPDTVKILVDMGADPNIIDAMGRTPLHWTLEGKCHCQFCSQNDAKCIELLRQNGANLDAEDYHGETPLHYAAKNMLPKCAVYLLDSGAKIYSISSRAVNIGYLMVQKIPESVAKILDRGVIFDEMDNSKLKLDFGVILQNDKTFLNGNTEEGIRTDEFRTNETNLLAHMLKAHRSGREILLTHPLVEAFLHLKWLAVRKWFWFVRFAYGLLITIYSLFVFDVFIWSCPYNWTNSNNETIATLKTIIVDESKCQPTRSILLMACFIIISIIFMILNEIFEYFNDKKMYLTIYLNFGWWVLILSMICTVLPAFGMKPKVWQYPLASLSLFYAWAMNLTQIGRIPYFGVYIEMLGKVLKDFAIFVMTYSSLMIAFTLGLCVMFPENEFFRNVPLAYVKTLLMMIGEPDYELLFQENNRMEMLAYSIPAHVIYLGFIFVITIVLMNLLLGLAVSDIQELRKYSSLTRSTRQITQIALLESFIQSRWVPSFITASAIRNVSVQSMLGESQYLCFAPMDPDDDQLPEDLKQKFVPYLTWSPCLIRPSMKKRKFFGFKHSRVNQLNISKVAIDYKNRPKEFRQMFILKSLAESIDELRTEIKKLSEQKQDNVV